MLAMIGAIDSQWGIGKGNKLLWNLPNDMKFFKETTEGGIVVMGRKTFESIGKPLPNRFNVVLTTNENFKSKGVDFVCNSVDDVLELYDATTPPMWIIGGSNVYKQFINYADRIYLTRVHHTFDDVDSYFPPIPMHLWEVVEVVQNKKNAKNPYDHDFITLDRRY